MNSIRPALAALVILACLFQVGEAAEKTELFKEMEKMGAAYKALATGLRKKTPDTDALVPHARVMLEVAKASVDRVPERARALDAAEQAEMTAAYRKDMEALVGKAEALIGALEAGDADSARATLKEMKKMKARGHKAYKVPEED